MNLFIREQRSSIDGVGQNNNINSVYYFEAQQPDPTQPSLLSEEESSRLPSSDKRSSTAPKICVIVRTAQSQERTLPALLHSLLISNYRNLRIVLIDTVTELRLPYLDRVVKLIPDPRVEISPRLRTLKPNEEPSSVLPKENSSGYVDSNEELERLLEEGWCEYFLWTNGDNMYDYDYLDSMLPLMLLEKHLVLVKFVTHHMNYIKRYDHFQDLGAGLVSRWVIGEHNIRFRPYDLAPGRNIPWHDSDYLFFSTIKSKLQHTSLGHSIEESEELHLWHL